MVVDQRHELNLKVLEYITRFKKREGAPLCAAPDCERIPRTSATV